MLKYYERSKGKVALCSSTLPSLSVADQINASHSVLDATLLQQSGNEDNMVVEVDSLEKTSKENGFMEVTPATPEPIQILESGQDVVTDHTGVDVT
ncbi:hypothetical protein L6452_44021 [Arctium lappa]|uniref:Uncharacterized protein n=1 Tax=Arctium lappa TaxID=4217 RepID=A0ACB8XFC4_ARCLA|nr:hypothetical protein L6452_44021 [Arctium lappa]